MDKTSPNAVASWIDTLNATVIGTKPRTALRDLIVQREINGRAFSMILNGHALIDFEIPDLTLAMATKIRKCWHADFPASVSIKHQSSVRGSDAGQRHDPCQDGADYSGYEGYAGYKTGPGTGTRAKSRDSPDRRGGDSRRNVPIYKGSQTARNPKPSVTITLELMRAALDSVAERAQIHRQEMYLGLRDVIPDEVWSPLWESYTSDLVRERHINTQGNGDLRGTQTLKPSSLSPQKSHPAVLSPGRPTSAREGYTGQNHQDRSYGAHGNSSHENSPQDELAHLPEMRARLGGQRQQAPQAPSPRMDQDDVQSDDDDLRSQAQTLRSEAGTIANAAVSAWLGQSQVSTQSLCPFDLANWLRTLPKDRLDSDTLKLIGKHVVDNNMDEDEFGVALAGGLAKFGVSDQRQVQILQRYFKQRQSEAHMAEAAKVEGKMNRQFNAKLEAKGWQT